MTALTLAEEAQVDYGADVARLDDYARDLAEAGFPLQAAAARHQAAIAYGAGRAERLHPSSPAVVPCGVCHGIRACDWDIHREAM